VTLRLVNRIAVRARPISREEIHNDIATKSGLSNLATAPRLTDKSG